MLSRGELRGPIFWGLFQFIVVAIVFVALRGVLELYGIQLRDLGRLGALTAIIGILIAYFATLKLSRAISRSAVLLR